MSAKGEGIHECEALEFLSSFSFYLQSNIGYLLARPFRGERA
jgi:hypothetical protein